MGKHALLLLFLAACGSSSTGSPDAASDASSACANAQNTSVTSSYMGCDLLARDTSSCKAVRTAAGLDGMWLKFSCRVTITASGGNVSVASDSEPDYRSQYFPTGDACNGPTTSMIVNPNRISAQKLTIGVPQAPTSSTAQMMMGGVVGVAVNGVGIFSNKAAPGDDIYQEFQTFDACGGHPQQTGGYHYHSEPYAISHDDAALVGVMRDGYAIYGRRDADNSLPTLDAQGGHTSATPDSATPVYHYHANSQTGTGGVTVWFLTTGTYHGAPGTCTGCN